MLRDRALATMEHRINDAQAVITHYTVQCAVLTREGIKSRPPARRGHFEF